MELTHSKKRHTITKTDSLRIGLFVQKEKVLSEKQMCFWEENGYVVVKNAVPEENLAAVVESIWSFLEIDPGDQENWYAKTPRSSQYPDSPISQAGMVEIYQHQSLWDNRQYPRIHRAFAQIWQTEKLWVSLDRANMKPPTRSQNPEWNNYGMIHWDVDTSQQPIPFGVQGVLYLTDTAENQGGFQCIPRFHHTFYDWVKSQPVDRNPRVPDLNGLDVKSIAGQAGDLLIWHRLLAHGNGHNAATQPRLAQYITMSPINTKLKKNTPLFQQRCAERIEAWRQRRPTSGWPGDPRDWEHHNCQPAQLTSLGRKLLGLDMWE